MKVIYGNSVTVIFFLALSWTNTLQNSLGCFVHLLIFPVVLVAGTQAILSRRYNADFHMHYYMEKTRARNPFLSLSYGGIFYSWQRLCNFNCNRCRVFYEITSINNPPEETTAITKEDIYFPKTGNFSFYTYSPNSSPYMDYDSSKAQTELRKQLNWKITITVVSLKTSMDLQGK